MQLVCACVLCVSNILFWCEATNEHYFLISTWVALVCPCWLYFGFFCNWIFKFVPKKTISDVIVPCYFLMWLIWELVQLKFTKKQLILSILYFYTLSWCGCLLYWTLIIVTNNIVLDIHVPCFYAMNLTICAL